MITHGGTGSLKTKRPSEKQPETRNTPPPSFPRRRESWLHRSQR
ncbi:hypothetical protein HMPREF9123_1401 [Neisseria bacilliformis ATCC BAA-1200]|uniref:Uncharacterized protein n=1 Tax=Neisseria bacilliformis ATCC BAA-1200 TaxID=888742 RepID=F2BC94_9NEIS|nr:hypothetical protein HMPREF9123_1401 [Neisseria bacilliformis ATCC BAA-1200]